MICSDSEQTLSQAQTIKCPEIDVQLQETLIKALVDTGSQVTCLSEEFYNKNFQKFQKCPTLPVVGTVIRGATGLRSTRLNKQIFATTTIGDISLDIVYLVVPKLARDCILGIDTLKEFGFLIDTMKDSVKVRIGERSTIVPYSSLSLAIERCTHRLI